MLTCVLSVYCHLAVALNYQNARRPIFLNESKFRQNGGCGYILKPKFLCGGADYDPDAVLDYRWGASCGLVHSRNLADHVSVCWRDKYLVVSLFEICSVSWKCLVVVWSLASLLYRCIYMCIYIYICIYIYLFIYILICIVFRHSFSHSVSDSCMFSFSYYSVICYSAIQCLFGNWIVQWVSLSVSCAVFNDRL